MHLYLKSLFVLLMLLNTAFVKLSFGLPVKDMLLLGLSALIFVAYHRQTARFFSEHQGLVLVFAAFFVLGWFLTVLNGRDGAVALNSSLRIIVQPFLILMCTYVLTLVLGLRFTSGVFFAFAGLTGLIAILQFLDIEQAWRLRVVLGQIQNEPASMREYAERAQRPLGISLAPITFSYHIAAVYILGNLFYRRGFMGSSRYSAFCAAILAMAIANGTRSLIFGIVVHEVASNLFRFGWRSAAWIALLGVGGLVAEGILTSMNARVVSVNDASAVGRMVLFEYGMQLAKDHPFGLGWGFDPGEMAWRYWDQLAGLDRAESIFELAIHNAYLNFFLIYGVFGVVIVAAIAALRTRVFVNVILYSTAYFLHAFFHNDGLFLGEDFYWFAFALFLHVQQPAAQTWTLSRPQPPLPSWSGALPNLGATSRARSNLVDRSHA